MEEINTDETPNKRIKIDETEFGTLAVVTHESGKRYFRVEGVLKGQKVIALIDFGALHNFISKDLLIKRRLKTQKFKGFKVVMGNGTID